MFDTHCHLNFKRFENIVDEVITNARAAGVTHITIPGTDIISSKKAIEIAQKHDNIYAAVGIHPHHVYEHHEACIMNHATKELQEIETLLKSDGRTPGVTGTGSPEVEEERQVIVAIGEIGLDRHIYEKTKYGKYHIDEKFISLQKEFFVKQIALAKQYKKSVIVHNREAKQDLLPLLNKHWDSYFERRMVFHCSEPDNDLLDFAKEKKLFWGVDGDVTYWPEKADFIKTVPLDMLVLETDSPFLLPEPLRTQKKFPNEPANLPLIAEFIAKKRGDDVEMLKKQIEENGLKLFKLLS